MCSTAIPPSADRCIACGAVWGEDNRCPNCHSLSAVRPKDGGYACLACGAPREKKSGTTVIGDGPGAGGFVSGGERTIAARGASVGLRLFGMVSIAGGVLTAAAIVALAGTGAGAVLAAVALGGLGVGVGAMALRGGAAAGQAADRSAGVAREAAILKLAEAKGGELMVTDVVKELGMTSHDADAALTAMADGSRVSAEVTSDGFIKYVFRELQSVSGEPRIRARVDADAAYEEALQEVEGMLEGREREQ